jgi:hypothetical protein
MNLSVSKTKTGKRFPVHIGRTKENLSLGSDGFETVMKSKHGMQYRETRPTCLCQKRRPARDSLVHERTPDREERTGQEERALAHALHEGERRTTAKNDALKNSAMRINWSTHHTDKSKNQKTMTVARSGAKACCGRKIEQKMQSARDSVPGRAI